MRRSPPAADANTLSGYLGDRIHGGRRSLSSRADGLARWREARLRAGLWAWSRYADPPLGPRATLRNDGGIAVHGLNFVTQDPLALSTHPGLLEVAGEAMRRYGLHGPGSPAFAGSSIPSAALEAALTDILGLEHVVLFPSGWNAAFGSLRALLQPHDHVVIDVAAHPALHLGATATTPHVHPCPHLDLEAIAERLRTIRREDTNAGILVVTESLFPFEADAPDLQALHELCGTADASLLVAIGHDLGVTGPHGTGILGAQEMLGRVDLVVGSFAKSLATNGGFFATRSAGTKQLVRFRAGTYMTSNALSPLQAAIARESLRIVTCEEGAQLRANLERAVGALRTACHERRLPCIGTTGTVVPIMIGNEHVARLTEAFAAERGVLVTVVEDPLLERGAARIALHVTAAHRPEHTIEAAEKIADALVDASASVGASTATR